MEDEIFKKCQCSFFSGNNSALVNCSSRDVVLTEEKIGNVTEKIQEIKIILRKNSLTELNSSMWKVAENTSAKIRYLDVSLNKIDKILPEDLPKTLTDLCLNNNSITEFNENTLKYLNEAFKPNSIQLGHNPYSCECLKSTIFLDYLNSGLKSKIRDTKDIFFSCSPPLSYVKTEQTDLMEEMCHATASIYGSSLLFSILVVCLLALVLTKKNYLRQRFYSLPWVLQRFPEDWSLHYDVFISYSDHDKDFVENVLWHQLEIESYACCVHTRHFVVGDAISDQILKAVDQSRRTIIVLSPEYAASDWTKLEFQAAHKK